MDTVTKARGMYGGLPRRAQLAIMGVGVLTIIVLFFVVRASISTSWVEIHSDMKPQETAKASTVLDKAAIPSKENSTGTAISVPKDQVSEAKRALGEENLLGSGHANYEEIYGKEACKYGCTSEQQKVNKKRVLEGKIASDIEGYEGVESASVIITMPDGSMFKDEDVKPTAAVFIEGGEDLTAKQIKGIQAGTAAAVEELQPEDVTVSGSQGLLSSDVGEDGVTGAQVKQKAEAQYNAQLENKLMRAFEDIAGAGRVKVLSNAELDMDEIQREVFDAGGEANEQGPIVSKKADTELLSPQIGSKNGVTGTSGNTGSYSGTAGGNAAGSDNFNRTDNTNTTTRTDGDTSTTETENQTTSETNDPDRAVQDAIAINDPDSEIPQETRDALSTAATERYRAASTAKAYTKDITETIYSNDQLKEAIRVAPGAVKRNKVTVVVDKSLPAGTKRAIEDSARTLVGVDAADAFNFSEAKLPKAEEAKVGFLGGAADSFGQYIKWLVLAIGMLGGAFFLRRTLDQRTVELMNPSDDLLMLGEGSAPIPLRELEAAISSANSYESQKRIELQRKVESLAMSKPADVAQQLRGWLHESERR